MYVAAFFFVLLIVLCQGLPTRRFRPPTQCRELWTNQLDPSLRQGRWTPEEEKLLIALEVRKTRSRIHHLCNIFSSVYQFGALFPYMLLPSSASLPTAQALSLEKRGEERPRQAANPTFPKILFE